MRKQGGILVLYIYMYVLKCTIITSCTTDTIPRSFRGCAEVYYWYFLYSPRRHGVGWRALSTGEQQQNNNNKKRRRGGWNFVALEADIFTVHSMWVYDIFGNLIDNTRSLVPS